MRSARYAGLLDDDPVLGEQFLSGHQAVNDLICRLIVKLNYWWKRISSRLQDLVHSVPFVYESTALFSILLPLTSWTLRYLLATTARIWNDRPLGFDFLLIHMRLIEVTHLLR